MGRLDRVNEQIKMEVSRIMQEELKDPRVGFVTIMRVRQGRPVFHKSPDHFVFRLMRQGYSATKAIVAMYLLALAFGLTALIVSTASNAVGTVLVAAVLVVAVWWAVRMAHVSVNA